MTSQSYQLMLRVGPEPGKVFELSKAELHVGRDVNNEITINDAELSRRHARLFSQGEGYVLEDLGSTNGTFVNGKRLSSPHALQPGETIRFGDNVTLSYEIAGFDPNATIASGQAAAPAPAAPPPVAAPPAAQPVSDYAGQVPEGPPQSEGTSPISGLLNNRPLVIGCVAIVVLVVCVALPAAWMWNWPPERWCDYFGFLFSACP
jgi:hypothetical protein